MNRYISEILNKRGITDVDEFLSESPKNAYDPFLMKNIREGVNLTAKHVKRGGRICIYGDYDADGITSTAILLETLREKTDNITSYIPRRTEGYGLNKEAIKSLCDDGVNLIITVDCGSRNIEEIEYAKERGLDVIITDHHMVEGDTSLEYMINPKFDDSGYPYRELAGCGVAFKFALALIQTLGIDENFKRKILDLVAIGTIGDMVPMLDENRLLVKYGLKALRNTDRVCVRQLFTDMEKDLRHLSEEEVGYYLVPHLNAPGRVDEPSLALSFIMEKDEEKANDLTNRLTAKNNERKELQKEALLSVRPDDVNEYFIVTEVDKKYEGVAGIIAGKLKDKYKVPVMILTGDSDRLKGSGRGIDGMDLFETIGTAKDCLIQYGGHKKACGLTIERKNVAGCSASLQQYMKDTSVEVNDDIEYDISPEITEADYRLFREIKRLAPFGTGNEMPLVRLKGTVSDPMYIGADKRHLKFRLCDESGNINCIMWNTEKKVENGSIMNVIGYLKDNTYRGRNAVQLDVKNLFEEEEL